MENNAALKSQLKRLIIENLMLQVTSDEISDDTPLFDPGGLGLDSVDALQLVVALDKTYGFKVTDPEVARKVLQTVGTIAEALSSSSEGKANPPA